MRIDAGFRVGDLREGVGAERHEAIERVTFVLFSEDHRAAVELARADLSR